ncbi:MAG: ferritin family protein [Phycisphaerae bacterium]
MPDFPNPFSGNVQRKLSDSELLRALRLNLAAEEEAVHLYMSHADATDNPLAKKVLIDIANEEREHIGEFQRLISILDPEEDKFLATGTEEVNEMAEGLGGDESGSDDDSDDVPSVGDMKE